MIDDLDRFFQLFDEYERLEVHDFLSALLLEGGFDPCDLTPPVEHMLAEFARRAGISGSSNQGDRRRGESVLRRASAQSQYDPPLQVRLS